jgi:hypothetical protein
MNPQNLSLTYVMSPALVSEKNPILAIILQL